MKILLTAATALEIRPFLDRLTLLSGDTGTFRHFRIQDIAIDVLVTGMGMIPTAYWLGKHLTAQYDFAVNAGICGSYKKELVPGTVVEVTEDFPVELGSHEGGRFLDIFNAGLGQPDEWPFREGRLRNIYPASPDLSKDLRKAKGATVSTLGNNPERLKMIRETFDPDVETMEGAAFLYCCLMQKIPSIQLRAVSNYVGETDRRKWQIGAAVEVLNETLVELVTW